MHQYILAIDQGTTSSRAIVFSDKAKIIYSSQQEFSQHFPQDGWVEHKPDDILQTVIETCRQAIAKSNIPLNKLVTAGITNQRETTLIWNKHTGKPVYNGIVWQDRRTAEMCKLLNQNHSLAEYVATNTGLIIDPYFSATKIKWVLDNVDGARQQAEAGELLFGTVDTFLIWHLTKGKNHVTDATNASRTMLFNIHSQMWDAHLLDVFDIPSSMLPAVKDSADNYGTISSDIIGRDLPIQGVAGDQQAALFGQACFSTGMAKSTYGTGCFAMINTGAKPLQSKHKLLTTVAYRLNGKTAYALEGSIFMAGATIQWLRDGMRFFANADESEAFAALANPKSNVYLVPAFTGLGAPYWDADARGAIVGLTRDTSVEDIVAAGLKAVCFQTADLFSAMENDGAAPVILKVDGGMSKNKWAMQYLANILDSTVIIPAVTESTALGVAFLAGLQAGLFKDLDTIESLWQKKQSFRPNMNKDERQIIYQGWKDAVSRVLKR